MFTLSSSEKEKIALIIEDLFDGIAIQLLGNIPSLKSKKNLFISNKPNFNLAHLFVQGMQNKEPNPEEKDFLKSLTDIAYGYIDSLKNKTKSNIIDRIEGSIREHKNKGTIPSELEMYSIIKEEFEKSKKHMKVITEAESSKFRNLGTMLDIGRVSQSLGDKDPNVFFVVKKDDSTCKTCIELHLMEDKTTPRVWKLSELKQGYYKRGESSPSAYGAHPMCRCSLSYVPSGYGFQNGKITYIKENHNELEDQRKSKK